MEYRVRLCVAYFTFYGVSLVCYTDDTGYHWEQGGRASGRDGSGFRVLFDSQLNMEDMV